LGTYPDYSNGLTSPCDFEGVTCDETNQYIEGVVLANHGIYGTFASDFGTRLPHIFSLEITNENFTGVLDEFITGIVGLQSLVLNYANYGITGTIPASQFQNWNLQFFILAFANVSGTIPTEFGTQHNLEIFVLDALSNIIGTVPTELSLCNSITQLQLSGLPGVNGTIPTFSSSLTNLDLSSLPLVTGLPPSMSNFATEFFTMIDLPQITHIPSPINFMAGATCTITNTALIELPVMIHNSGFPDFSVQITVTDNAQLTFNFSKPIFQGWIGNFFLYNSPLVTGDVTFGFLSECNIYVMQIHGTSITTINPSILTAGIMFQDLELNYNNVDLLCPVPNYSNIAYFSDYYDGCGACDSLNCTSPFVCEALFGNSTATCNCGWTSDQLALVEFLGNLTFTGTYVYDPLLPPCGVGAYPGVTCNSTCNINQLDLSGYGLVGTIGLEFQQLQGLIALNLSNNALGGTIPSNTFNDMFGLASIDVSNNQFNGIYPYACQFGHLFVGGVSHYISNNAFSGILNYMPLQSCLASLYANGTQLQGQISRTFLLSMNHLSNLDLRYTNLSSIASDVSGLPHNKYQTLLLVTGNAVNCPIGNYSRAAVINDYSSAGCGGCGNVTCPVNETCYQISFGLPTCYPNTCPTGYCGGRCQFLDSDGDVCQLYDFLRNYVLTPSVYPDPNVYPCFVNNILCDEMGYVTSYGFLNINITTFPPFMMEFTRLESVDLERITSFDKYALNSTYYVNSTSFDSFNMFNGNWATFPSFCSNPLFTTAGAYIEIDGLNITTQPHMGAYCAYENSNITYFYSQALTGFGGFANAVSSTSPLFQGKTVFIERSMAGMIKSNFTLPPWYFTGMNAFFVNIVGNGFTNQLSDYWIAGAVMSWSVREDSQGLIYSMLNGNSLLCPWGSPPDDTPIDGFPLPAGSCENCIAPFPCHSNTFCIQNISDTSGYECIAAPPFPDNGCPTGYYGAYCQQLAFNTAFAQPIINYLFGAEPPFYSIVTFASIWWSDPLGNGIMNNTLFLAAQCYLVGNCTDGIAYAQLDIIVTTLTNMVYTNAVDDPYVRYDEEGSVIMFSSCDNIATIFSSNQCLSSLNNMIQIRGYSVSCSTLLTAYTSMGCCTGPTCDNPASYYIDDNAQTIPNKCAITTQMVNLCNYELTSWIAVLVNKVRGLTGSPLQSATTRCLSVSYPELTNLLLQL